MNILKKKITYKEGKTDTVPHQKITLYPIDYIPDLRKSINDIKYIKYSDIIEGYVCKTRNICDYINDSSNQKEIDNLKNSYQKEIDNLKLENKLLRLKLQEYKQ